MYFVRTPGLCFEGPTLKAPDWGQRLAKIKSMCPIQQSTSSSALYSHYNHTTYLKQVLLLLPIGGSDNRNAVRLATGEQYVVGGSLSAPWLRIVKKRERKETDTSGFTFGILAGSFLITPCK